MMIKNFTKIIVLFFGIALISGCAAKDYQLRTYIQDKERVDQALSGNAGYLYGTPKEDTSERKKTRQVYVVEMTKKVDSLPDEYYGIKSSDKATGAYKVTEVEEVEEQVVRKRPYKPSSRIIAPILDETEMQFSNEGEGQYINYKVEKDDTLQKISKKFYGTFSKWTKIYQLNKDKIKNPDMIQPGIEIRIPKE
ncbi:MAG: LysM peptidoglycan-binding domain-containing protein [Candidatus Omnitrophica bacterium]|nr:LysM peptidoglycan-binding domain-containing protein [Candidatus Omnitrophota bacterium]